MYHLVTVNRAKPGDEVEVFDGKGTLFWGCIEKIGDKAAQVAIHKEHREEKPPAKLVVAPSLVKKKNMHLLIEKLAEIGVDEIRPLYFSRTDEKFAPSMLKKWRKIALQSLKVNKRLWLPGIFPPEKITGVIENTGHFPTRILLDIEGTSMAEAPEPQFPTIVVIGPPGDFLEEERRLLLESGFIPYRINPGILKTETATLSIAAILNMIALKQGKGQPIT